MEKYVRSGRRTYGGRGFWPLAAALALSAFVAVCICVTYFALPFLGDDLWYVHPMRGFFAGPAHGDLFAPGAAYPLAGVLQCISDHMNLDNVRLINVIFAAMLPFGKPLMNVLSAAMAFAGMVFLLKVSGCGLRSVAASVWMLVLWSGGLVLFTVMWEQCYVFNYIWCTAVSLFCLWIYMRPVPVRWWVLALCGFLCGVLHEGFGVPLGVSLLVGTQFVPGRGLRAQRWAMAVAMLAGSALLFVSPGAMGRMPAGGVLPSLHGVVSTLKYHGVDVLFALMLCMCLCRRAWRRALDWPLMTVLCTGMAVSFAIHARVNIAGHVGWWANICAIAGCLACGRVIAPSLAGGRVRVFLRAATVVAAVGVAVHFLAVCVVARRVSAQIAQVTAVFCANPGATVFYTPYKPGLAGTLSVGRPLEDVLSDPWHLRWIGDVYAGGVHPRPVPAVLQRCTKATGVPVGGTPGLRRMGGCLYIAADSVPPPLVRINPADGCADTFGCNVRVRLGNRVMHRYVTGVPFVSAADGVCYYYVFVTRTRFLGGIFGPVTAVWL